MAGASPNFSDIHIIRTLIALQTRIGRKKLLKEIGIGEGSMRTILKKLKTKSLIDSTKKGHKLNDVGLEHLNEYLKKFTIPFKIHADDIVAGKKTGIVVRGASGKITTGLLERDTAVRAGASGALILKCCSGAKLKFPDEIRSIDDYPGFTSELVNLNVDFNPGDVLIVAFSDCYIVSENACIAIALNLIE